MSRILRIDYADAVLLEWPYRCHYRNQRVAEADYDFLGNLDRVRYALRGHAKDHKRRASGALFQYWYSNVVSQRKSI